MQALKMRSVVDKNGFIKLEIPPNFGKHVEVIVFPAEEEVQSKSWYLMKGQEMTGFAREVLARPEEDVWNDV